MNGSNDSLEKCLVPETATIMDAMKAMTAGGKKIAVVVNEKRQLQGVVTDGDIRRGLLKGINMNAPVTEIMVCNPVVAKKDTAQSNLLELFRTKEVQQIPILTDNNIVHSVISIEELITLETVNQNAVILMVGGLGSRLGELTSNCPKPLLKIGEKPILESIIENFKTHGFKNFFLAVNYRSEMIESYFGNGSKLNVHIEYLREKERMGTAGALSLFEPINDLPVIVMNGDLMTHVNFNSLLQSHIEKNAEASVCVRQYDLQIPFGVVQADDFKINRIEEKPIKSFLVNAGIYVLNKSALNLVPENSYFDMPSLLDKMLTLKQNVCAFPIHEYWLDIGRKDDFEQASNDFLKKLK